MYKNISRKTIIIIIAAFLLLGLGIGGCIYFKSNEGQRLLEKIGKAAGKITESAIKGVLPSIETNPLGNKPDINPADKANPFKNIKINPFE